MKIQKELRNNKNLFLLTNFNNDNNENPRN